MATAKNTPFFDFDFGRMADFSKLMSDFKGSSVDMNAVMAAHRRNVEALTAAHQLALEGMQAVARRQAEIVRQTIEETGTMLSEIIAAGTPEDKVARQADMMKTSFEKALANVKELSELITKSNAEAAEVINKRVSEGLDELKTVAQKAGRK